MMSRATWVRRALALIRAIFLGSVAVLLATSHLDVAAASVPQTPWTWCAGCPPSNMHALPGLNAGYEFVITDELTTEAGTCVWKPWFDETLACLRQGPCSLTIRGYFAQSIPGAYTGQEITITATASCDGSGENMARDAQAGYFAIGLDCWDCDLHQ